MRGVLFEIQECPDAEFESDDDRCLIRQGQHRADAADMLTGDMAHLEFALGNVASLNASAPAASAPAVAALLRVECTQAMSAVDTEPASP